MCIYRSLCQSFNFVNTRFAAEIIFFPIKLSREIYFHVKFITEFYCLFFCFHLCPFGWVNLLFTENNFFHRLIKDGSDDSPHCILLSVFKNGLKEFQSVNYATNFKPRINLLLTYVRGLWLEKKIVKYLQM